LVIIGDKDESILGDEDESIIGDKNQQPSSIHNSLVSLYFW